MTHAAARRNIGGVIYLAFAMTLGAYFTFAAVQGDYGVFRRVEILAEADSLKIQRDRLASELSVTRNLTHRISDAYLDMDLLDQQARQVLGYMRPDEIVIR